MRTFVGCLVSLTLALAIAGVAVAAPKDDQYNNKVTTVTSKPKSIGAVSGATASQPKPSVSKAAAGALPFTGFQLGLVVVAGTGLLGAGIALRRMSRQRDDS
jgi:hypothetical protein